MKKEREIYGKEKDIHFSVIYFCQFKVNIKWNLNWQFLWYSSNNILTITVSLVLYTNLWNRWNNPLPPWDWNKRVLIIHAGWYSKINFNLKVVANYVPYETCKTSVTQMNVYRLISNHIVIHFRIKIWFICQVGLHKHGIYCSRKVQTIYIYRF